MIQQITGSGASEFDSDVVQTDNFGEGALWLCTSGLPTVARADNGHVAGAPPHGGSAPASTAS